MVAIKDLEIMPRSCMNCDMFQMVEGDYGKCRCYLTQTYVNYSDEYLKKRADYCPLVEIEERKGKWIGEEEGYYSECSCCGASFLWEDYKCIGDWKYCPKCGAEMTKE